MAVPTVVKVLLALVPRAVMATMHTTIIRANITAYSTAVGPSSCFRKRTTALDIRDNMTNLFLVQRKSMCPETSGKFPDPLQATCPEKQVEWQGWEALSFRWTTPFGSLAI